MTEAPWLVDGSAIQLGQVAEGAGTVDDEVCLPGASIEQEHDMQAGSVLGALGRGMVAGAVGTVVMTLSETLEMSLTGREGSQVPGEVGAHLLPGRDPHSVTDVATLNSPVHWAHGISMGALRGVLDLAGLRGPAASAAHFALLWGGDAALYRSLGVADAPWRWTAGELGTDMFHKGVYAVVTGATYDAMSRS